MEKMTKDNSPLEQEIMEEFENRFSTFNLNDSAQFNGVVFHAKDLIKSFLLSSLAKVRRETLEEVKKVIEDRMMTFPEKTCINAETKMFGRCFDCCKTEGNNFALSSLQEIINNKIKE